ncbi:MAG: peptidylprolyl isomerase [Labilithrix sp.]|nr:peptidylprolyl isomerase [Labilithrix sp.]MBX3220378.1 peptidylprolyl isomerase [Labilithrix sp.]
MKARWVVLASGLLGLSCGRDAPSAARSEDENAALGGEVAARVGAQTIPLSVVASVAQAQHLTPAEAARKVVDDEIAASAARGRGLDQRVPASWRLVSTRARFAADRFLEEAKRRGPPTDDEVLALSERHWAEVDRPPSVSVIHAIAILPKDPALVASARALADELRAAASSASSDDFEAKAKAVPHDPKLSVRIEKLPPFTEEGWVTEGGGAMDATFAKAAFALPAVGATSAVVETGFGFHVIRLLARHPEKRMPMETRRLAFAAEVYSLRARDLMNARLTDLRAAHRIAVAPAAEELMRTIQLSQDSAGAP